MTIPEKRARPREGKPTTYRGLHDMAGWWRFSEEKERPIVALYGHFVHQDDLVFDIGANRGRKTWALRQLGARVVAVDPLFAFGREFVPEFWWRFGKDPAVTTVDRAVTAERRVDLAINRFMPYVSSIDRRWMTESAHAPKFKQPYYRETSLIHRQVGGIRMDELINIYGLPRFVKVDVEGHENEALSTLSWPIEAFNMEFHRDWIPDKAMAHMEHLGAYVWNYALGNEGEFAAEWMGRRALLAHLGRHLTNAGPGSWGDIYGRLVG
jgi:FkbM family methyltransferase